MRRAETARTFRGEPSPEKFNVAQACLARQAIDTPDKPALIVVRDPDGNGRDEVWAYGALEDAVLRTAGALADLGVRFGDRVLLRMGNSADLPIAYLAISALGAIAVPLSDLLSATDIEFVTEDTQATVIIMAADLPIGGAGAGRTVLTVAELRKRARKAARAPYADTSADDPAHMVYTSGATSRPKGVLHAQRALWGRRPMYADWCRIEPDDRVLHAGALNWSFTLGTGLLDPLVNGATGIIYAGPRSSKIWPALINRLSATIFAGVPTVYRQILKYCDICAGDMPTLRQCLGAGETLGPELNAEWHARTGLDIHEAFGMSEISTYISSPPGAAPRPGSPGRAQRGRAVAILSVDGGTDPLPHGETGLIAVHRSDPALMIGYWNRPEEQPFRGDWFVTGDMAAMDKDGFIWPAGRRNDVIKVLGYRVSPKEVEEVIRGHPGVEDIAAVAVEPRPGVSILCACIVATDRERFDSENVLEFARARLAAYKVPHQVVVVEDLPRTANGKVLRSRLREERNRFASADVSDQRLKA